MSSVVTAEWTCERCGATTVVPHGAQPDRWHQMRTAIPPRHAEPTIQGDLCENCWDSFCDWWRIGGAESRHPDEPQFGRGSSDG